VEHEIMQQLHITMIGGMFDRTHHARVDFPRTQWRCAQARGRARSFAAVGWHDVLTHNLGV